MADIRTIAAVSDIWLLCHHLVSLCHPAGGIMLCVDARFTDWFGKSPIDCVGRPLSTLALDGDALAE
jgi:hypothetical protein